MTRMILMLAAMLAGPAIQPALAQGPAAPIGPNLRGPVAAQTPCRELAAIVQSRGSVVVVTGPYTFERVVRDGSLCQREQTSRPDWLAALDNPQCFAGYRCVDRNEHVPSNR